MKQTKLLWYIDGLFISLLTLQAIDIVRRILILIGN